MNDSGYNPAAEHLYEDNQSPSVEVMRYWLDFSLNYQKLFFNCCEQMGLANFLSQADVTNPGTIIQTFMTAAEHLFEHPIHAITSSQNYIQDYIKLCQAIMTNVGRIDEASQIIKPVSADKRFRNPEWHENSYYNFMMQSYLLWDRWVKDFTDHIDTLDDATARKVRFYTRQITDSLSPNNFAWTNPEVVQQTIETQGQNLVQGIQNFLNDLQQSQGQLNISMVDRTAFQVGHNIATTPGQVIFQNDLIQLIQYKPLTEQVYHIPLLLIPPCINKFYIYDLRPENSFVKWLLEQGFTVFMVSWVNPDEKLSHKSFEDYVFEGVEAAIKTVKSICKVPKINTVGFCIGGNFLSTYAAFNATQKTQWQSLNSTTYLATLFDFNDAGDLLVFIDPKQVAELEKQIHRKGYFDGQILARTFNLLRANDLIWSFVINNYMMGKEPQAFDLLFWNSDSTNLPSDMYLSYLRKFFLENRLIEPGGITVKNTPIDLRNITVPSFVLSTREDHIAPWQSGYAGANIFSGPTKFVLGGSGHIAGIFNHPRANKYQYWIGEHKNKTAEQWLDQAESYTGSWWIEWVEWVKKLSGPMIAARVPGSKQFPPLEAAPGSYVRDKSLSQPSND